jgi:hypothetical protein
VTAFDGPSLFCQVKNHFVLRYVFLSKAGNNDFSLVMFLKTCFPFSSVRLQCCYFLVVVGTRASRLVPRELS